MCRNKGRQTTHQERRWMTPAQLQGSCDIRYICIDKWGVQLIGGRRAFVHLLSETKDVPIEGSAARERMGIRGDSAPTHDSHIHKSRSSTNETCMVHDWSMAVVLCLLSLVMCSLYARVVRLDSFCRGRRQNCPTVPKGKTCMCVYTY
jgi:hypothetical protein